MCQAVQTGAGFGLPSQLFSSSLTSAHLSVGGPEALSSTVKCQGLYSLAQNLKLFHHSDKININFLPESLSIYSTAGLMLAREGKAFLSCVPPVHTPAIANFCRVAKLKLTNLIPENILFNFKPQYYSPCTSNDDAVIKQEGQCSHWAELSGDDLPPQWLMKTMGREITLLRGMR